MKVCPLCGESYHSFVDFCFADGEVLTVEETVSEVPEPEGFDAPPPPKMLQGSQQSASYTRSATPVPRARRPGRTLVNRPDSGGGVYSPPAAPADAPVAPTEAPAPVAASNLFSPDDDEVLEAPPMVEDLSGSGSSADDDVQEVASYEPAFDAPEEPRPAPLLDQGSDSPGESDDSSDSDGGAAMPPRGAAPLTADPVIPPAEEDDEASTMSLVVAGLAVLLLLGVVAAVGALAVGAMMGGGGEGPDVVDIPEPVEDPQPQPGPQPQPDQPNPDAIQVGPVPTPDPPEPDGVEPDGVDPDADDGNTTQPDPEPDGTEVRPDPQPAGAPEPDVRPTPDPDGVAVVGPRPSAKEGEVLFRSTPDGAVIVLDGEKIGTTQFTYQVPYGEHQLRLEKEGYEPVETSFSVNAPSVELAPYSMVSLTPVEPAPAPIAVKPRPDGYPRSVWFFHAEPSTVAVKIDGSTEGCPSECMTPVTAELPGGTYTVSFNAPSGEQRCVVEVPEGSPSSSSIFVYLHQDCRVDIKR